MLNVVAVIYLLIVVAGFILFIAWLVAENRFFKRFKQIGHGPSTDPTGAIWFFLKGDYKAVGDPETVRLGNQTRALLAMVLACLALAVVGALLLKKIAAVPLPSAVQGLGLEVH